MLTEIGVKFGMQGADDVSSRLHSLQSAFSAFGDKMGEHTKGSGGHFNKMADSLEAAATRMHHQFGLLGKAAIAFGLGKAVQGTANWILGGHGAEMDQLKDNLRLPLRYYVWVNNAIVSGPARRVGQRWRATRAPW